MPYPTPNRTDIILLHEVPLDSTYRNSIYFSTAGGQATYFLAHKKGALEWTQCMYHRNEDEIRVDAPIDQCMDINYVMYKNDSYGAKWFYAFVTGCRYVNANCTALKIELDVLQTWYFDYELMPCFIERCHTTTDVIGENIVRENLDIGGYVTAATSSPNETTFNRWAVVAYSTFDWSTWQQVAGQLDTSTSVYSGLRRTVIGEYQITRNGTHYDAAWITNAETKLYDLVYNHANLVDGLILLTIVPSYLETHNGVYVYFDKPIARSTYLGAQYQTRYIPRNNKLYTAPFTVLMISNNSGAEKVYNFEDFGDSSRAEFRMYTDRAPEQSVNLIPEGYRGSNPLSGQASSLNVSEMISMTGFPQAAWVSNAFMTYIAQHQANLALTAATGLGNAIGGAMTGDIKAAEQGAMSIFGLLADVYDASKQPPIAHGQTSGYSMMAVNEKAFRAYMLTPRAEYCRIIDNYFDMFGYTQNKIGNVNINARPVWTYTRTRGAVAKPKTGSGCTAADLAKIQSIFDNGVTFWADGYQVGDYSLDNRV